MKTYSRGTAVLRVAGAVAARTAERRERPEERLLHAGRGLHGPAELGELVEDDRELEERRIPALPHLAVAREPEQRLEQHLRLERRPRREADADRRLLGREDAVLRA